MVKVGQVRFQGLRHILTGAVAQAKVGEGFLPVPERRQHGSQLAGREAAGHLQFGCVFQNLHLGCAVKEIKLLAHLFSFLKGQFNAASAAGERTVGIVHCFALLPIGYCLRSKAMRQPWESPHRMEPDDPWWPPIGLDGLVRRLGRSPQGR